MRVPIKNIPTFDFQIKEWTETSFDTQEHFANYLESLFKEPGKYEFDECTTKWNEEAKKYDKVKYYCMSPVGTKDYKTYWNTQKNKSRRGVIYKNNGKEWYVTRDYHMLLNFLPPAQNKEKNNKQEFLYVRDVQYHIALYHKIAEAKNLHGVIVKKRQCASSIYHAGKMLNVYWFEKDAVLRNLAGDEAYLTGDKGLWNYYNGFRDFLNEHTGWIRPNNPNQDLKWEQKIETYRNGKKSFSGRKSKLTGTTFKRSPTAGVGGSAYYNYFEEAGTFPKLDKTYIYMRPQLESGAETTGYFMAAGSVGELKDCGPLKKFVESPLGNKFYGVQNTWINKDRIPKITGLYIPEQWGYPPFIDEWGNSLVEEALEYINAQYKELEKEMEPEDYQLHISQHPRYMEEAFAYREVSKWPMRRIEKRQSYVKDEKIDGTHIELFEDEKSKLNGVSWRLSNNQPVSYPVDKKLENKEGVAIMYEAPETGMKYYAGIDTIAADTTTTSDSLFSIYIHKGVKRIVEIDSEGKRTMREEGVKLVFHWTGRFNSAEQTNRYGAFAMRLYNSRTLVERNKENFISYCIRNGYAANRLLKEKELPFNKEMDFGKEFRGDEYGIYMDSTGKKQEKIESYGIEYINQEIDAVYKKDKDGLPTEEKVHTYYGIDRIPDYWLLEELKHIGKENTDRAQAWLLSLTAAKTFETQGFVDTVYVTKDNKKPKRKITKSISFLSPMRQTTQNKPRRGTSFLSR